MVLIIVNHLIVTKNNFLVLREGPTDGINDRIGATEQKFGINFTKAKTKFYLSLHYNDDNSYLFINGKKFISLIIKM